MTSNAKSFQNILIILPRQLGDILLGSSIAFALRQSFPNACITWLAHPMGRQLLTGHPALNEVIYYPVWKPKSLREWFSKPASLLMQFVQYIVSEFTFLKNLRGNRYDLVIDCICTPKTAIITASTGARVRHGIFTRWNRNWAYTWLCRSNHWKNQYAAHARLQLLNSIIDKDLLDKPPLQWLDSWMPAPSESKERVQRAMTELGLEKNNFVVLSPTSRRPLRQWPAKSFADLAVHLVVNEGLKVCWFWGPGEFEFTQEICKSVQERLKSLGHDENASCMPPLLSLSEAAIFSGESALWIGNTNGLSHVAVAGGAKTVQIYGPTSPKPWIHPNAHKHLAVQRTEGCVNCDSNNCKVGTHECMQMLGINDVLKAVRALKTVSAH